MIYFILVVIFILDWGLQGELTRALQLDPTRPAQAWRIATYGLVHVNLAHLCFNFVGVYGEQRMSRFKFGQLQPALILVAGVVVGGAVSLAWSSLMHLSRPTAGVSAGIYAVWCACAARPLKDGDPLAWTSAALLAAASLAVALFLPADNAAHLGGAMAGLALGVTLPSRKF